MASDDVEIKLPLIEGDKEVERVSSRDGTSSSRDEGDEAAMLQELMGIHAAMRGFRDDSTVVDAPYSEPLIAHLKRVSAILILASKLAEETIVTKLARELCKIRLPELIVFLTKRVEPIVASLASAACDALTQILQADATTREYGRKADMISFATDIMRSHLNERDAAQKACRLARRLMINEATPDSAQLVAKSRLAEAAIDVMRAYMSDSDMITSAAFTLSNYTAYDLAPETIVFLNSTEAIGILSSALGMHTGCRDAAGLICAIIGHVSGTEATNDDRARMVAAGVDGGIYAAMLAHPTDKFLQTCGTSALGNLSAHVPLRGGILQHGLALVLSALVQHPAVEDLWENACVMFGNLAVNHCDALMEAGVPAVLLDAMQRFLHVPDVMEDACYAVLNMSWPRAKAVTLAQQGMATAVVAVLRQHPTHELVVKQAVGALARLSRAEENQPLVINLGVVGPVLQAMKDFPQTAKLQEYCARVLSQLATRDDAVGIQIFQLGAMQVTFAAMERFPHEELLITECCIALCFMAYHGPHTAAMIDAGVIDVFVRHLRGFPNNKDLVSYGCDGLAFLAMGARQGVGDAMLAAGAVELVAQMLHTAAIESQRFASAAAALERIAHSVVCRRRFLTLDVVEPLIQALLSTDEPTLLRVSSLSIGSLFGEPDQAH